MQFWRIHLKTNGAESFRYCLKESIIGIGWDIFDRGKSISAAIEEVINEYVDGSTREYNRLVRCINGYYHRDTGTLVREDINRDVHASIGVGVKRIINEARANTVHYDNAPRPRDFVWTRNPDQRDRGLYLCKITGDWDYACANSHRIVSSCPCEFREICNSHAGGNVEKFYQTYLFKRFQDHWPFHEIPGGGKLAQLTQTIWNKVK